MSSVERRCKVTSNILPQKGIRCESCRQLKPCALLVAKNTCKPFRLEAGCKADFVFVEGVGPTLLSQETAVQLDILRIGPVEASSVSGEIDSDTPVR